MFRNTKINEEESFMASTNAPFPLTNKVTAKLGTTDYEVKNGGTDDVQKIVIEEENIVFYIFPNQIYLYSHPISTGREWHSNGAISVNDDGKVVIELV
tara:strand:- start:37 stop:330 length:294 start_codon:yes stop_codon:yes gene_type:complete